MDDGQALMSQMTIERMHGKLVAHRFAVKDWAPGWAVGVVEAQSAAKKTRGQWEVSYKGFNPEVYLHKLVPTDCGPSKNWCFVSKH